VVKITGVYMPPRKDLAKWFAIVGGILLIIAGVNGIIVWETLRELISELVGSNSFVETVFFALIILASLGGISVIIGGFLLGKERILLGKVLIFLGAGLISLGAILTLIPLIMGSSESSEGLAGFLPLGAVGLLLAFLALFIVRDYKPNCKRCNKRIPRDSIFCPYCGRKGVI
jgi:hypothetical protein